MHSTIARNKVKDEDGKKNLEYPFLYSFLLADELIYYIVQWQDAEGVFIGCHNLSPPSFCSFLL